MPADADDPLVSDVKEARRRFLALVADVRPDLHRYCARMTGSVIDGEDIVQDTLARAYYSLADVEALPALRAWLFRIAHHRALDFLGRYERRMSRPLDTVEETAVAEGGDPEQSLEREALVRAALSSFLDLAPAQRSSLILKDVLGHGLDEIAGLLELSVPAVKALLHRGRAALRARREAELAHAARPEPAHEPSPEMLRYAALFNARDWDGVRSLLAEDVRLDLVAKSERAGRRDVGGYVDNYAKLHDWLLVPGWLDGRETIGVLRQPSAPAPAYFIELGFAGGRVTRIRDFRYVPYIARDAAFDAAHSSSV